MRPMHRGNIKRHVWNRSGVLAGMQRRYGRLSVASVIVDHPLDSSSTHLCKKPLAAPTSGTAIYFCRKSSICTLTKHGCFPSGVAVPNMIHMLYTKTGCACLSAKHALVYGC